MESRIGADNERMMDTYLLYMYEKLLYIICRLMFANLVIIFFIYIVIVSFDV